MYLNFTALKFRTGTMRAHGLTRLKMKISNFIEHHWKHFIVVTKLFANAVFQSP